MLHFTPCLDEGFVSWAIWSSTFELLNPASVEQVQGYLAHKKLPPLLRATIRP